MKTVLNVLWAIITATAKDAVPVFTYIAVVGGLFAFVRFALVPAADLILWIAGGR